MSKRYYWLKLKNDFFEEEDIRLLENMDNGKDYVILLLKLRLRSINTNGHLNFKGLMPYNEKMLATITNTNIDIVRAALKVFREIGLISMLDDGTLYMDQVETLIGSESSSAERTRKYREKLHLLPEKASHCNSDVQNSDIEIDIEKDIEKDIEIEKEKESYGPLIAAVVNYLNEKCRTDYRATTRKTRELITARAREGFGLHDFHKVIDKKVADWKDDSKMRIYLRPVTLFGTKFESYLNERKVSARVVTD